MFDVTNFLMRWLFLCNLVRDVAEIQTLPHNPNPYPHQQPQTPMQEQYHQQQQQQQQFYHPEYDQQHNMQPAPPSLTNDASKCEEEWRENCLRGILSYPAGTQRLLVMDALRAELVQQLSQSLFHADRTLEKYEHARRLNTMQYPLKRGIGNIGRASRADAQNNKDEDDDEYVINLDDSSCLDADVEILKTFQEATMGDRKKTKDSEDSDNDDDDGIKNGQRQAVLTIDTEETATPDDYDDYYGSEQLSYDKVEDAQATVRHVRDYLPQLVSVVLKSPPAFEPNLVNPIQKLRRLIVQRCMDDANWGIDMCWLLEAEVGRAWKSLFEHRQQTGRRLIVVLPTEKAAVLAKIGTEKCEAFDLLQDAEQATAYGYTSSMDDELLYEAQYQPQFKPGPLCPYRHLYGENESDTMPPRLPSSLSLRRCSHFGDTMHFIDRLTRISLDLRRVPIIHRLAFLQDNLREINRRLRRRMVTRGDVSLDVEDDLGPDDWPQLADVTSTLLRYSVHLPLEPKQQKRWPGGDPTTDATDGGVVRVLNIVVDECRLLSSRERCPFLVLVEVAETGLRGNDGRLYASGAPSLGATVEEALSMSASSASASLGGSRRRRPSQVNGFAPYEIPPELLANPSNEQIVKRKAVGIVEESAGMAESSFPRGGDQTDETIFYPENPDETYSNPYEELRQNEYEQLHQRMYSESDMMVETPHASLQSQSNMLVSTREALLDKVFGQPWMERCEEIRQASPFGQTIGWRLAAFIMKAGEDIRRESLVMQIITKLNGWFQSDIPEHIRPHMRPYTIMCVGGDAGLVECLSDAKSIDEVKKRTDNFVSLRDYFERAYGPPTRLSARYTQTRHQGTSAASAISFEEAQENFLRSLVGYSLVCYILQIKDRHNANILLDRLGNIMHIDFGFVLGESPKMSKVPIFSERAPFKLSAEFWDVIGGWHVKRGGLGVRFCRMFEVAFECANKHSEEICSLVEATMLTLTQNPRTARVMANGVRSRLRMRGEAGSADQKSFVMELVNTALTSWGTSTYDWLQKNMNGYE